MDCYKSIVCAWHINIVNEEIDKKDYAFANRKVKMFEQIKLTYNYNGLEPVIDALTVETHYAKHHAAYAKNFNDAAEKAGVAEMGVEELLASLDKIEDPELRKALRNNGGGFYNHNLYCYILYLVFQLHEYLFDLYMVSNHLQY